MNTKIIKKQAGVIPAGTTGQVLAKLSNADYDVAWINPPVGPTNPGDITSGFFTDNVPGFGMTNWNWQRVGNLYFNIWGSTSGGLQIFGRDGTQSFVSYFAALAGSTAQAAYASQNYGAYTGSNNSPAPWTADPPSNNTRTFITAVLIV